MPLGTLSFINGESLDICFSSLGVITKKRGKTEDVARDTLKIYSDRTECLHVWPINRRFLGMKNVVKKDL